MLDYITGEQVRLSRTAGLVCVMAADTTQIISIPLFGALSDRIGRRKQYLAGAVLLATFAIPLFWLIEISSLPLVLGSLITAFTVHAVMYGSQAAMYAKMFPADVRFLGTSLNFQITSVFAGGFAPFIMTALLAMTASAWSLSLYIIAMTAITFVALLTTREHFRRDLYETSTSQSPER